MSNESPPAETSPAKDSGWHSPRWWRMTLKEAREILRDRRTILTLVAMPLLIYPLLGVTLKKLLFMQLSTQVKIEYQVALESRAQAKAFGNFYRQAQFLEAKANGRNTVSEAPARGTMDDPVIAIMTPNDESDTADVLRFVDEGDADLGIRMRSLEGEASLENDPDNQSLRPWECEFIYRPSSPRSLDAKRFLEDKLRRVNENFAAALLVKYRPEGRMPLSLKAQPLPLVAGAGGPAVSLATLVPLILILMTVTGAVYPAIDLTAGERERGTLEALVSAPVPRHELLFAKYLAVLGVALMTAVANLISMIVTAYASGIEGLLFGRAGLTVQLVLSTLGLLTVFAAFFSSVILVLTSFARSFKEAQAYLIPVMLVSLAPGVMCLLPGIEMNGAYSVTPLVNIVLLARDVFDNRASPLWAMATLVSTVLYSAVALAAAARIFGTDAVLYGSDGGWNDLWRKPEKVQSAPSLGQAMFGLAAVFPMFLILGSIPSRFEDATVSARLLGNAAVTTLLFALFPLILTRLMNVSWTRGLRLVNAPFPAFASAALLGLSLWPFAYEVEVATLSSDRLRQFEELFQLIKEQLDAVPLWLKLVTLAIVPAVCEEIFFRGFLLTAFRREMSVWLAVVFSGSIFGLFHVILRDSLFFERFLPTTLLGIVLGVVCVRSGSILPGIVLHTLHNGLLLTLSHHATWLKSMGIGIEERQHLPLFLLAIAGAAVLLGAGVLWVMARREPWEPSVPTVAVGTNPESAL